MTDLSRRERLICNITYYIQMDCPIEDAVENNTLYTLEFDWVIIETGYKTSPEENPKQIVISY